MRSQTSGIRRQTSEQNRYVKKASIRFPLSAFRFRMGISLIEVMISMGVLALGLLGVAALFPVGGFYMQQSDISDRADAIAESALNDAIARGLLDPENWLSARIGPSFALFDQSYVQLMRSDLATAAANAQPTADVARQLNLNYGSVLVVDPLGVAATMNPNRLTGGLRGFTAPSMPFFPASTPPDAFPATHAAWRPWAAVDGAAGSRGPIRRVAVLSGGSAIPNAPLAPMPPQARRMVQADDDLSIALDDYTGNRFEANPDSPSQQPWTATNSGPLARQSRGDFSWLLSVVPTTFAARNGLATDPESFNYDVSIVVMHRREVGGIYDGGEAPLYNNDSTILSERMVRAAVGTTGVSGGQLRVFADADELAGAVAAESPFEKLRAGQWVMLFGPHPDSSSDRPLLFCQWYRVVSVEEDPAADASVFVSGPDWPWAPGGDVTDPASALANDLRLVIMPDVVAVHTRTMKLNPGAGWDTN